MEQKAPAFRPIARLLPTFGKPELAAPDRTKTAIASENSELSELSEDSDYSDVITAESAATGVKAGTGHLLANTSFAEKVRFLPLN